MFVHVCLLVFFSVARSAEACSGTFTGLTGSIQSPNYPNRYDDNLRCFYTITAPVGHRIKLTFTHMELEITHDYVEIRDGGNGTAPLLGGPRSSSRTVHFITRSSGNQMWIKFHTDGSVTRTGFYATYESVAAENYFFLITSSVYGRYSGPTIYRVDPESFRYDRIPLGNVDGGYNQTSKFDALYNPIAIDYDPVEDKMYWTEETAYWTGSDTTVNRIRSAHLNGSNVETVLSANSRGVVDHNSTSNAAAEFDGIAVDPLSRLIFYSDVGNKEIVMLTMSSHARKTVVNSDLERPRAIVLHTANGVLYWTDWGTPAKIERANYDGSNRTTVVSTNLNYTNGLAIDVANNKLYWVDAYTNRLESSDLEGNGRTVLYTNYYSYHRYYNRHFIGLALLNNSLYVTDWGRSGSRSTSSTLEKKSLATSRTSLNQVMSMSGRLNDIHAYHEKTQASGPNGCRNNNGGCSVICIPLPNNRSRCACPDGQNLTSSGTDCIDDGFPKTTTSPPRPPTPFTDTGCHHNYTALSGTIQTHNFPSWYRGGIACTYVITAPKGYRITLNVTPISSYSRYNRFEVRDGGNNSAPLFNTPSSDSGLPFIQRSFGNQLWVRHFQSNSLDRWYTSAYTRTRNGFNATYTSEKTDDYFLLVTASPWSDYSSSPSQSQAIYRVDPDTASYYGIPMDRALYNPTAIDYDPVEQKIYWTEKGSIVNRIRSSSLNGRNIETVLNANTVNAEAVLDGIAVDPLSRLIFYTDAGNKEIVMLTMSSPHQRKIVAVSAVDKPRAVVLDPTNGVVYWTEWGTPAKIERANYDGTNRTTIVSTNLNYTNGLAIDVPNNTLYWVDAGTDLVESSDLEGKGRTVLYGGLSHGIGLALCQNLLYITNQGYWRQSSYASYRYISHYSVDPFYLRTNYLLEMPLGKNVTQILSMSRTLKDIHAYHEKTLARGLNGCGNNNGGCGIICIPLPKNRSKCACPDGQNLTSDGKHCGDEPPTRSTTTSSTTTTRKLFVVQASISSLAPNPFVTNGLLELNLTCVLDHNIKVIGYEWNVQCFHIIGNTCVWRPRASDDGKNVTCMANMEYGWTSHIGLYQFSLKYPPPSAPTITGYTAGEMKQAGERLTLTCTVNGGKPLVTSVNFWCTRHPDNKMDVKGQNKVESVLDIRSLEPEDNATSCVCMAEWINHDSISYKLSETITLRVNGTPSNVHGKTEPLTDSSTSLGPIVGAGVVIIIIIVIVGIVCWKKRRSGRDNTYGLVSNMQYTADSESLS